MPIINLNIQFALVCKSIELLFDCVNKLALNSKRLIPDSLPISLRVPSQELQKSNRIAIHDLINIPVAKNRIFKTFLFNDIKVLFISH